MLVQILAQPIPLDEADPPLHDGLIFLICSTYADTAMSQFPSFPSPLRTWTSVSPEAIFTSYSHHVERNDLSVKTKVALVHFLYSWAIMDEDSFMHTRLFRKRLVSQSVRFLMAWDTVDSEIQYLDLLRLLLPLFWTRSFSGSG